MGKSASADVMAEPLSDLMGWRPMAAMAIIGVVYFIVAQRRFRQVIFGG